jgi:peptidoglycan/LPS O-acetylase OafA/YrhL
VAPRPRLLALDGLRLIAALMVVLYHYVSSGIAAYWHANPAAVFRGLHLLTAYGWMGVNLFFLISGFVICMSSWGRGLGDFFVSRVVRLYPAYWIGIVFTTVMLTLLPFDRPRPGLRQILANLTMLQTGIGVHDVESVYWTLWKEILFYLLFAIVVWRGVDYHRVVIFCALWTTASVITPLFNNAALSSIVDQEYSMYFIGGVAMYLMYRFRPTLVLWGIVIISLLLAAYSIPDRLKAVAAFSGETQSEYVGIGLVVAFFGILLAIALGWTDRIRWRWLTTAGALTYPLYLIHGTAGFALINHFSTRLPKYPLMIGLVVLMMVAAWSIHRIAERPASRLLRRGLAAGLRDLRHGGEPVPKDEIARDRPAATIETPTPVGTGARSAPR